MKPKVIAVVGAKKVGKTTTTENLIEELSKRGLRVAAIKHVSEPEWTIDTPGKDTYRFAQKGAKTIVVMGSNEIDTIEKGKTEDIRLKALLKKAKNSDLILTEGLKQMVARKTSIPKIAVVTSKEEAEKAMSTYKPIIAFSGPYNTQELYPNMPYVDATKNSPALADLIQGNQTKKKG